MVIARRREHHRSHDRSARREGRSWTGDSNRKIGRDIESRSVRYRDDLNRDKERDFRKNIDVRDVTDVRDIRLKKDIRDARERPGDKVKEERQHL